MSKNQKKSSKIKNKLNGGLLPAVLACLAVAVVLAILLWPEASQPTQTPTDPAASGQPAVSYYADITIEGYGTVTVALDAQAAPITVANFVELAESGFYDGLTFHRIIEGFMMQGGAPKGNTTAQTIKGEFTANGVDNTLLHTRGAISMARSKQFDSASSQFFIVHQDSPHLDGEYACFGYVTAGMEIVDAVCTAAQPVDGNGSIAAEDQPVITQIRIYQQETALQG